MTPQRWSTYVKLDQTYVSFLDKSNETKTKRNQCSASTYTRFSIKMIFIKYNPGILVYRNTEFLDSAIVREI